MGKKKSKNPPAAQLKKKVRNQHASIDHTTSIPSVKYKESIPTEIAAIENNKTLVQSTLPVVFICDDNYTMVTSVAITTLIENKRSTTALDVYIIATDLCEENYSKFYSMCSLDVNIHVVKTSTKPFESIISGKIGDHCVATVAALLKFEIPNLLPSLNKVLYLDGDIIVRRDLMGLYNTKLNDKLAGVVVDSSKLYTNKDIVCNCPTYFNSGVMVLNLYQMRIEGTTKVLFETKKNLNDNSLMDQHVFNMVFENRVVTLPIQYNFLYINLLRANKKYTIKSLNSLYSTHFKDLIEIRKQSYIIHFASKDKPWKYYDVKLADEWYEYYKNSPFGTEDLVRKSLELELYTDLNRRQKKQIKRLNEKFLEIEKKMCFYRDELDGTRNSLTYKIGSLFTCVPKLIRKAINNLKELYSNLKILLPKLNGLNKKARSPQIIVSLTSYDSRIKSVPYVIGVMLRQTVKPDKIILNLNIESQYSMKLPVSLRLQNLCGVDINYTEDLKPHTKYYNSMCLYPNEIVITLDDDVLYENDLVEKLYQSYLKFPNAVSAMRVHRIKFENDGSLKPYQRWQHRFGEVVGSPSMLLFATGVGGVLYPPNCMHKELFNKEMIKKTCLNADDLWLKIMQVMNNTKVVLATNKRTLKYVKGTQVVGLFHANVGNDANDVQMQNILDAYNLYYGSSDMLLDRIKKDELDLKL